jgi:hypothetical protein
LSPVLPFLAFQRPLQRLGPLGSRGCAPLSMVTFKPGPQLSLIGDFAFRDCPSLSLLFLPMQPLQLGIFKCSPALGSRVSETMHFPVVHHFHSSASLRRSKRLAASVSLDVRLFAYWRLCISATFITFINLHRRRPASERIVEIGCLSAGRNGKRVK